MALVTIVAAALRFWRLDHAPIWMDEAFSILVGHLPMRAILFGGVDVHPPLFYAIQKLWTALAPAQALARGPAAVFGIVNVAIVALLAADQAPRRAVLPTGLFLALGTAHVYFSQDARMYTLLGLATTLATWGVLGLSGVGRLSRPSYALLYVGGATVAIYTHFLALPYLLAANVAWLARKAQVGEVRTSWRPWLLNNLILLTLVTPWLLQLLTDGTRGFNGLAHASLGDIPWMIRNVLGAPGLPSGLRQAADVALFASFAVGVWAASRRSPSVAFVMAAGLALYPALIIALDRITPILANRVFLPSAPLAALTFGYAIASIDRRGPRIAALVAALALVAASTAALLRAPSKYEDIPGALAFADRQGAHDAPLLTCTFFTAGSLWENAPTRRAIILQPDNGVLRFDPGFYRALSLTMAKFMHAKTGDIDRAAGGGYQIRGGLAEAIGDRRTLVVITQPCDPFFADQLRQAMTPLGFKPVAEAGFLGGQNGHVILQPGATRVVVFKR